MEASVIIPSYKRPKETVECIHALFNSHGLGETLNLEVIIVDDTPDESVESAVKSSFDGAQTPIHYMHPKKNQGISGAKNLGVKHAKHSILVFLDTDVMVEEDTVPKLIGTLKDNPTTALVGGSVHWIGGPRDGQMHKPETMMRRYGRGRVKYVEAVHGCLLCCYKQAFDEVGGFDTLFNMHGENADLDIRLWRAGYPLAYNPDAILYHRYESSYSITRNVVDRHINIMRSMLLLCYKYDVKPDKDLYENFSVWMQDNWMRKTFASGKPFLMAAALAESVDWLISNRNRIQKRHRGVPHKFDFKPYEVFSDKRTLKECLTSAKKRIASLRRGVF